MLWAFILAIRIIITWLTQQMNVMSIYLDVHIYKVQQHVRIQLNARDTKSTYQSWIKRTNEKRKKLPKANRSSIDNSTPISSALNQNEWNRLKHGNKPKTQHTYNYEAPTRTTIHIHMARLSTRSPNRIELWIKRCLHK